MFAAALLGTPRLCRWAPDVPSDAEPLFDLERSAFGPRLTTVVEEATSPSV